MSVPFLLIILLLKVKFNLVMWKNRRMFFPFLSSPFSSFLSTPFLCSFPLVASEAKWHQSLWLWHPWIAPVLGSPLSSFLVTQDGTIEGLLVFFKSCAKEEARKLVRGGKIFTFAVLCCLQELGKLTDASSENDGLNIYKKYSHKGSRRY